MMKSTETFSQILSYGVSFCYIFNLGYLLIIHVAWQNQNFQNFLPTHIISGSGTHRIHNYFKVWLRLFFNSLQFIGQRQN